MAGNVFYVATLYMYKYIAFLFALLMAMASCSHGDDPTPGPYVPQKAGKTIFVFMPYTGSSVDNPNVDGTNLYYSLLNNISDMETAVRQNGGLGNCHLIIYIACDSNTSHLINIGYHKGSVVRDTLKTYTSPGYMSADGMASILADIKHYAPADTYATIVGSHGEGWLPKYSTTRFFGGLKYQMDVTDFAAAILAAGLKMQFVMFDDCYMSGVEVAYDLKDAAQYLIASTSEMMGYGMPYHNILKYLMADKPDYESLCRDFISFYRAYSMPYGTIAVTDLSRIDSFAALMKQLNSTHLFDSQREPELQDLDVAHFTPTVYYDLGSYLRLLCGADAAAYGEAMAQADLLVPYRGNTDMIYSSSGKSVLRLEEYSGLTCSDPSENIYAVVAKKQTAWWKATH